MTTGSETGKLLFNITRWFMIIFLAKRVFKKFISVSLVSTLDSTRPVVDSTPFLVDTWPRRSKGLQGRFLSSQKWFSCKLGDTVKYIQQCYYCKRGSCQKKGQLRLREWWPVESLNDFSGKVLCILKAWKQIALTGHIIYVYVCILGMGWFKSNSINLKRIYKQPFLRPYNSSHQLPCSKDTRSDQTLFACSFPQPSHGCASMAYPHCCLELSIHF